MISELDFLQQFSKVRISECSCNNCVAMCQHQVCIGTPEDIASLIVAGHIEKLTGWTWAAGSFRGYNQVIDMVQLRYDYGKKSCIMLENGLCSLHHSGLKPKEGKFANCKTTPDRNQKRSPVLLIAQTWLADRNKKLVHLIEMILLSHELNVEFSERMLDLKIELSLLKGRIDEVQSTH